MSYCRWSSDDFRSDIYCYESSSGFEIHVACNRRQYSEPLPPPLDVGVDDPTWPEKYFARHSAVMAIVDRTPTQPIGLPFDGESYTEPTARAATYRLELLQRTGYNVPQYAIDDLRAEHEDALA